MIAPPNEKKSRPKTNSPKPVRKLKPPVEQMPDSESFEGKSYGEDDIEMVSKVLGQLMPGYPSTPHLPFSPGVNSDDIKLPDSGTLPFLGTPIVITEKLDGGNCCLYRGRVFARTHKHEASHASFGAIKQAYAQLWHGGALRGEIGRLVLFGELLAAVHSIDCNFSFRIRHSFYLSIYVLIDSLPFLLPPTRALSPVQTAACRPYSTSSRHSTPAFLPTSSPTGPARRPNLRPRGCLGLT
jgi:hypothetical protein